MVDNIKSSSSAIVFEDPVACNDKICEEMEQYSYEVVILGLDCEWVSQEKQGAGPVSPVALLQLAFPNGTCFLIRLCKMEGKLPPKLRDILEDRTILKMGVGINEDVKKLNLCYDLVMQGCVDLRHVALRCWGYMEYCITESGAREGMSLSALSQQILGITMDKDWKIRCSNWEASQLSERQVAYAANDAIVAVQIFFMLAASKLKERESRLEAGKTKNDEDIHWETNSVSSKSEKRSQSRDLCGNACNAQCEPLGNPDMNSSKEFSCVKDNFNKALDGVASANNRILESSSSSHETNAQNEIFKSKAYGFQSAADKNETSLSAGVSEGGILSNLVTKLTTFSLGSVLGMQSQLEDAQIRPNSKHKTKSYTQYASFKTFDLNEKLFSSPEFWNCITPLCHGIVDVPYKIKAKHKGGEKGQNCEKGKQSTPVATNKVSGLKPRRAPLYQNCVIEAPDGEMLSTCDKRKAEWYLCRDLAQVVKEDPYTIRLNFEPSGRPFDPEHNYYLTFKENICVVCGRDDSYMRKNIIPHDYRKHFPVCMKDHHSHDVLLLCPSCHMISTYHDDLLRRKLAEKYRAPLASSQVARLVQDPELKKVKSAAKALFYAGEKIPETRRNELLSTVKDFLKMDNPTREMLLEISELETRRENCDFISHGREVVQKVKEGDELLAFERMWREHFLETMKPRYLPPLWTVDHEQEKFRGHYSDNTIQRQQPNKSTTIHHKGREWQSV